MGRIITEIVENKLIITKYESDGSIIPDKISQNKKVVAIIKGNLDTDSDDKQVSVMSDSDIAVPREEFLIKLLSIGDDCSDKYKVYCKGLYSSNDIKKGITWAEAAYLLHYVGGIEESIEWSSIRPDKDYKVCVLHEVSRGGKVLDEKLANYKSRLDMENYISSIITGKRFIPLPLYCSFVDLMHNDGVDFVDLKLNMMFKKMSKEEFKLLF